MKCGPYHSANRADPDVYHDHMDCPAGQQIPLGDRRNGTNGYRRCEHCRKLG